MKNRHFGTGVGSAIIAALALVAIPGSALSAAESVDDEPVRIVLRTSDIKASNQEAAEAHAALASMWTAELRRIGAPFRVPRLVTYRGNTRTDCGIMPASNAVYCFSNNTIYFDEVFLAAQAKLAGHALGTDGDMAAVGIIAHEMGHAVAFQLGARSRVSYQNESIADCLAGAFARRAESDGSLEDGDLEEAFWAMAAAGDPAVEMIPPRSRNGRRSARLVRSAHGTREQRQQNFRSGLVAGGAGCLDELRAG